jgi:hypothetical protein
MDILLVAERLAKTDVTKTLVKILKKKAIQKFITDLNTKVQLFDYGEDATGMRLDVVSDIGGYAPSTISIKARKGQPTNRVTLKDTGDFYKTFDVIVNNDASFKVQADTMKGGQNLEDRWGEDIVGLQEENVILVLDRLRDEFYKAIYK